MVWLLKMLAEALLGVVKGIIGAVVGFFGQVGYTLELTEFVDLFGKDAFIKFYNNFILPFAYCIIVIVLLWGLWRSLVSKNPGGDVDEPFTLVFRSAASWAIVTYFGDLFSYLTSVASTIFQWGIQIVTGQSNPEIKLPMDINASDLNSMPGITLKTEIQELFIIVLQIYFLGIVAKAFAKLILMWGERYVYYAIIATCAPVALATFASKRTNSIAEKYFTSIISAIISLLFTQIFITVFMHAYLVVAGRNEIKVYLIGMFALLGLSKFIMELDDYLNKIGLINEGMTVADMGNPLSGIGGIIKGAGRLVAGGAALASAIGEKGLAGAVKERLPWNNSGDFPAGGATPKEVANSFGDVSKTQDALSSYVGGRDDGMSYFSKDGNDNLKASSSPEGALMSGKLGTPINLNDPKANLYGTGVLTDGHGQSQLARFNEDGSVDMLSGEKDDFDEPEITNRFKSKSDLMDSDMDAETFTPFESFRMGDEMGGSLSSDGLTPDNFQVLSSMDVDGQKSFEGVMNRNGEVVPFAGEVSALPGRNDSEHSSVPIGNGRYMNIDTSGHASISSATQSKIGRYYANENGGISKKTPFSGISNNGEVH